MDELTSFRERRKKARAESSAPWAPDGPAPRAPSTARPEAGGDRPPAAAEAVTRSEGASSSRSRAPESPARSAARGTAGEQAVAGQASQRAGRASTPKAGAAPRAGTPRVGTAAEGTPRVRTARPRRRTEPSSLLPPDPGDARRTHQIGPTISMETVTLVESALEASHSAGDYTYENLPSVVRTAVDAYIEGKLPIGPRAKGGPKKRVSTLLTETEFSRYQHHFAKFGRKKGEVIERVVLAFLANSLKT